MTPRDLRRAWRDWERLSPDERTQVKQLATRLRITGLLGTLRWLDHVKSDCEELARRLRSAHGDTKLEHCTHAQAMEAEARALRWAECMVLVARASDEEAG